MSSFTAPFYGKIRRLSVNPSDNTLWMVAEHPNGRSIAPVQFDIQALLDGKSTNDTTTPFEIEGVASDVLGHNTGLYVVSTDGVIYRLNDTDKSKSFDAVHTCEAEFGLQAMIAFGDSGAGFPTMEANGSSGRIGGQNRKLLLVGTSSALVVDVAEDGSFTVGATLLPKEGQDTITAWAADTVFAEDGQTHHCAVGWKSGEVSAYFTDDDSNAFNQMALLDANEVELTTSNPLHAGSVSTLAYVREFDKYGNEKRHLLSAGMDMGLFQISLLESIAVPRKNYHDGRIVSLIPGGFADGDSRNGRRFSRFYTLSTDNTVKSYLSKFDNNVVPTHKSEAFMSIGTTMVLNTQHSSGVYGEGEHRGKAFPTPHLVMASATEIRVIPITKLEEGDVVLPEELRKNGVLGDSQTLGLVGGRSYANEVGRDNNEDIRRSGLARFKSWDVDWMVDFLKALSINSDYSVGFRNEALDALIACEHPRKVVLLEHMLRTWQVTNQQKIKVFKALKGLDANTLRFHKMAFEYCEEELKSIVVDDLAELARGNGALKREAFALLQEILSDKDYAYDEALSLRAYDHVCGENYTAVVPGVEGVLYGVFAHSDTIRREMVKRLAERKLTNAFETTLILRRLLESTEDVVRERAVDVSLLRASKVADVLRRDDKFLHERLYVLENGTFPSTMSEDEKSEVLQKALPTADHVATLKGLFAQEDVSVQEDLDVLIEFSTCTKDDVAIYALQARASFGFDAAAQGLLKMSESSDKRVKRQAVIGLGHMTHLEDVCDGLEMIALSSNTSLEIGAVVIELLVRAYDSSTRGEYILRKVLDGGNSELRETVVTIAQKKLSSLIPAVQAHRTVEVEGETEAEREARAKALAEIDKKLRSQQAVLAVGREHNDTDIIESSTAEIAALNQARAMLLGQVDDVGNPVEIYNFDAIKELFVQVLTEETGDESVQKEVFKSYLNNNLDDPTFSDDKKVTFYRLLNLRSRPLFRLALTELKAYIAEPASRSWALELFAELINQSFKLTHHSNVWSIWTEIADFAQEDHSDSFEQTVLRLGFEVAGPCQCEVYDDGSFHVCDRHRIRRSAFLRILSASGDWLADFIRDALNNVGGRNKDVGDSALVLAVSDKAKKAVANMDDPEAFIVSMLQDISTEQKQKFAQDLLLMYPRYYKAKLQQAVYEIRTNPMIASTVGHKKGAHLMTEALFEHYFTQLKDGQTQFFSVGLERFAVDNGRSEEFAKALYAHGKTGLHSLLQKALELASAEYADWGKALIEQALNDNDTTAKEAFRITLARLKREAKKLNSDAQVKEFVMGFFANASEVRQLWVVEVLKLDDGASDWELDILKSMCVADSDDVREKGFEALGALRDKKPWVIELLKKGLVDARSSVVGDLCFQALLTINRVLGSEKEKEFLTDTARQHKHHQERVAAAALTTTASWRIPFILEALNDEDPKIRLMMCEKVKSTSGLLDDFFEGLLEHQHVEIRNMATQVLSARGAYTVPVEITGSIAERILRDPPRRPMWNDSTFIKGQDKYGNNITDWSAYSAAVAIWVQEIRAWKSDKIDAIIAAGKTHDTQYYTVLKSALYKFGYEDTTDAESSEDTDLWIGGIEVGPWTDWSDWSHWCEFIILQMGWVLSQKEEEHIEFAVGEAEDHTDARVRVAWNVACTRAGCEEQYEWLVDQFYRESTWRDHNEYKEYIVLAHLIEGAFAVDSFVGWDSKAEGPAYSTIQRLMTDDKRFASDLFQLSMLRLSHQGGPVDAIAMGYTSCDDKVKLDSVRMRECQHDKDALFDAIVELLNDGAVPENDPYALSNVGGRWYDVVRLTLELHTRSVNLEPAFDVGHWHNVAQMLSCDHPQLRARAVDVYINRTVHGEEKERSKADVENFARQLIGAEVQSWALYQDKKVTTPEKAQALAFDGYMGLIRDEHFPVDHRKDALTYISKMVEKSGAVSKVLPVLKTALSMSEERLRFQAYTMLIALQDTNHDLISLNQLTQMGLRSTDARLKRLAVSLIWGTDQLSKADKVAQLESILKNVNDVSARYAFDVLYVFAGRPSAWDQADVDKDNAISNAESIKNQTLADLDSELNAKTKAYEQAIELAEAAYECAEDNKSYREIAKRIEQLHASFEETESAIEASRAVAKEAYRQAVAEAHKAHEASMNAPLSEADTQTWSDAKARQDELLGMAIGAYFADLRTHAVDTGLTEAARRRPYFEKEQEEFAGYFERLVSILESALHSPYADLERYTALKMAANGFSQGYKVLLELLASHDGSDQSEAINALVQLGPIGLTEYTDENGEPLPRTAVLLLDRAGMDEFGTVERYRIFQAIGQLKDRHSSVRDSMFEYLSKGPDSNDYGQVLNALIAMTGCADDILCEMRWADLTPEDFSELRHYLPREVNWEHVDLEKFEAYYQDVVDEQLLADIMNDLMDRGEYNSLSNYGLIEMIGWGKGFDVYEKDGQLHSPTIDVLRRLAGLFNKSAEWNSIACQAINALLKRLEFIECMRPSTQGLKESIATVLASIHDANKDVIDETVLDIAIGLANARCTSHSKYVFDTLLTVATKQTETRYRREMAIRALGPLGDERAVLPLLNLIGLDAYGEMLLVEDDMPQLSDYDKQELELVAAEAIGGMVFSQSARGIFQLLMKQARTRKNRTCKIGYNGLVYFLRTEEFALEAMDRFAYEYQVNVNADNNHWVQVLTGLLAKALTPLATESHPDNASQAITPETEKMLKDYILCTLFGEVFEMDGEARNPQNVRKTVLSDQYKNQQNIEVVYQLVRQLVHGPHQTVNVETSDDSLVEAPIDFSYLADLSDEERIDALKAECALFKNWHVKTKYTDDVAKVLAEYLPTKEIFDLASWAIAEGYDSLYNGQARERYNIIVDAIRNPADASALIQQSIDGIRMDATEDIEGELGAMHTKSYFGVAYEVLENNIDVLGEDHIDAFVALVQEINDKFQAVAEIRAFGDTEKSEPRNFYFWLLEELLKIACQLPSKDRFTDVIKQLLSTCHLVEDTTWKQDSYAKLLEMYLDLGQIDWDFVDGQISTMDRELRGSLVSHLNASNAAEVLPRVLKWVETDAAVLSRLVDVLNGMSAQLQEVMVSHLSESGDPASVMLVLSRLRNVDAFASVVESFRQTDEDGSTGKLVSTSDSKSFDLPIVFRAMAMMATDTAEYYLRDIASDKFSDHDVRDAALKAANVAYRRRVPLHVRRAERT